jgi:hypothetical protein
LSYLVCDKCGGYYRTSTGELTRDFDDKCHCGGKFKYLKKPLKALVRT